LAPSSGVLLTVSACNLAVTSRHCEIAASKLNIKSGLGAGAKLASGALEGTGKKSVCSGESGSAACA